MCHGTKGGPNPEKSGPEGWGPEGWEGPKFRVFFFSLSPLIFVLFLSLTVCLHVFFWWCLEAPGLSNVHVWSSLVVVRSPGGPKAAGVSHHSPRAQTCTSEGPSLHKDHQNSTRRHTVRERKNDSGGGRLKKSAKFWAVQRRGVRWRGVRRKGVRGRGVRRKVRPGDSSEEKRT